MDLDEKIEGVQLQGGNSLAAALVACSNSRNNLKGVEGQACNSIIENQLQSVLKDVSALSDKEILLSTPKNIQQMKPLCHSSLAFQTPMQSSNYNYMSSSSCHDTMTLTTGPQP